MATPKKKRSKPIKKKGRIVVSQKAKIVRKGTQTAKKDTLQRVEGRPPANNAPTLKLKIRKK